MKRILTKILLLLLIISAWQSSEHAIASWAFPFVQRQNNMYKITNEHVNSVGKEIGSVNQYSDKEGSYSGNFSNALPVGTKYFEIPGSDTSREIAVYENGEYVKAEFVGHVVVTNAATKHAPSMEYIWYSIFILPFVLVSSLVVGIWLTNKRNRA